MSGIFKGALMAGVSFASVLRGTLVDAVLRGQFGPTLLLNFLSGTLDPRITFTRGTTATFVGSNGLIQTAAVDAPRFDYNPVTLAPRGMLIEEQRTNLLVNSLINGTSLSTQGVTVTAVPHTISFYGTGSITLSGASVAVVSGTGVYPNRQTLTFTPSAGTLTCTVVGSVQYAQLEVGAFATSFIPTTASTVTRSADVATMTGTNFSSWYNQNAGTMLCNFILEGQTAGGAASRVWGINNSGSTSNEITLRQGTVIAGADATMITGGVVQVDSSTFATPVNTHLKSAFAWSTTSSNLTANGVSFIDGGATTPPTVNQLVLTGSNKWLQQVSFYNTRLPNATLQALTT